MQTLTAGSFLHLENSEAVERLKFTARRLAEHTTTVIAQNLQPAALENLANDLWQKAEYVARETERRRLREIFVENFCERFRELKPEVSAEIPNFETQPEVSPERDTDSIEQPSATIESARTPDSAADGTTEVEGKKDEFLGFVESGEPFVETPAAETNGAEATAMGGAPKKTEHETIEAASEDEPVAVEKVSTENRSESKPQSTAATVADAKDNPPATTTSAVKNNATAPKSANVAQEPFEFGKCTVSLSLTLMPASGDERGGRRAIVGAASHNLPPEIEFLEIGEGEDLTEIAALVKNKLERFKQTLPAKYIEQLRQSKTKTAKKPATTKPAATSPASTKPEIARTDGAKTSGGQQARNLGATETEKAKAEITATKETLEAQPAPVAPLPQSQVAASNVQPSLF